MKHANRKAYQLEFVRCFDDRCSHCASIPKRENQFLDLINEFGGSCPSPQLSEIKRTMHVKNDLYNPTTFGSCEKKGCTFLFFSMADKKRHERLMKHWFV